MDTPADDSQQKLEESYIPYCRVAVKALPAACGCRQITSTIFDGGLPRLSMRSLDEITGCAFLVSETRSAHSAKNLDFRP